MGGGGATVQFWERANRREEMAASNEQAWWRRTRELAIATLAFAVALGLLILILSEPLDRGTVFGLPFGYFLAAEALPLVLAALIFWSARRQADIDQRHGLTED